MVEAWWQVLYLLLSAGESLAGNVSFILQALMFDWVLVLRLVAGCQGTRRSLYSTYWSECL